MQSNKLWTKQFISVSLINFLLTLVFYLLMVTIATFAINHYQASMSQSGLVSGIFIIGGVIGRLFAGYFINKFGLKRLLLITIIICLAIISIYFININVQFLILIRLLHGIPHGMALTIISSIATQIIPESRKSEGISYYSMSTTLATAFGPFLGILMIHYISFSILFSFCFAIMFIALIMSTFVKAPKVTKIKTASVNLEKGTSFLKNIIEPRVIPVGLIILLLSFAYSGVLTYLNLYASQLNLTSVASLFFVVYAIVVLLTRPVAGKLMDNKGNHVVVYPAIIFYAISMFMLSQVTSGFILLLISAIMGLGFGNLQSATQVLAVKSAPTSRISIATSTYFIFFDAGLGLSPYLLGYVTPLTGYGNMYAIMGVIIIITGFLYFCLIGNRKLSS